MANHTAKAARSRPARQQAVVSSTAAKSAPESKPISLLGRSHAPVTAEARQAMIAEAAYYIAEQRGFGFGREVEDWLLAEKQVDAKLSA